MADLEAVKACQWMERAAVSAWLAGIVHRFILPDGRSRRCPLAPTAMTPGRDLNACWQAQQPFEMRQLRHLQSCNDGFQIRLFEMIRLATCFCRQVTACWLAENVAVVKGGMAFDDSSFVTSTELFADGRQAQIFVRK
jgi:hypothetical protein